MRTFDEYRVLRDHVERAVQNEGHKSYGLPLIYFGAMCALRAMNSKDEDVIDAFNRIKSEQSSLIAEGVA